jgi:hypothetical protein
MRAVEDAFAGGGSSNNSRSAAVSAIELVFGRLVAAGTVGGVGGGGGGGGEGGGGRTPCNVGTWQPASPCPRIFNLPRESLLPEGNSEGKARARAWRDNAGSRGSPLPPCAGLQQGSERCIFTPSLLQRLRRDLALGGS